MGVLCAIERVIKVCCLIVDVQQITHKPKSPNVLPPTPVYYYPPVSYVLGGKPVG